MRDAERVDHPLDIVRPFAVIAVVFYCAGFWGYEALTAWLAL